MSKLIDTELIGMSKQDAIELAKARNVTMRIVVENGEHFMVTDDYWMNRLNIEIKDNKVVKVSRG